MFSPYNTPDVPMIRITRAATRMTERNSHALRKAESARGWPAGCLPIAPLPQNHAPSAPAPEACNFGNPPSRQTYRPSLCARKTIICVDVGGSRKGYALRCHWLMWADACMLEARASSSSGCCNRNQVSPAAAPSNRSILLCKGPWEC